MFIVAENIGSVNITIWAASSEKGAYGNLKKIVRYMLAFDYYEGYLLILR